MPKNAKFDRKKTNEKIETCGVNANTKRAKKQCEKNFMNFVESKIENSKDIFTDATLLEDCLIEFFETYRKNDEGLPSKSTLNTTRSHIKGLILRVTKNQFDISNEVMFPNFVRLWKAKSLELKQEGLGDPKHVQPVPISTLEKLFELLKTLTRLMEIDETDPDYHVHLERLPSSYRENYNKLVLNGAIVLFILFVSLYFFHNGQCNH